MKYNLIVAQMIRPNAIELFSKLLSKNTHVFCDGNIPIGIADLFVCFGVSSRYTINNRFACLVESRLVKLEARCIVKLPL